MQLGPLRVWGVGAVVDDVGPIARSFGLRRVCDVRGNELDTLREVVSTASGDGSYALPRSREVADHGQTQRAGAKDHVEATAFGYRSLPRAHDPAGFPRSLSRAVICASW